MAGQGTQSKSSNKALRRMIPRTPQKDGWEAMQKGEASVIHGLENKMEVAAAGMMTDATTAKLHRAQAEPGSGNE